MSQENTSRVRFHSAAHAQGVGELRGVELPAVVLREDGTLDVYGQVTVLDQAPADTFGGYTPDQLKAAWALVPTNEANWKMPIHGFVPEGTDTAVMSAAIAYYCGSPSDFRPQPDGRFEVEAPGYYTCVGS